MIDNPLNFKIAFFEEKMISKFLKLHTPYEYDNIIVWTSNCEEIRAYRDFRWKTEVNNSPGRTPNNSSTLNVRINRLVAALYIKITSAKAAARNYAK